MAASKPSMGNSWPSTLALSLAVEFSTNSSIMALRLRPKASSEKGASAELCNCSVSCRAVSWYFQNRIHLSSLSRSSSPEFLCQKYIRSRPCLGPRLRALFHSNCPYISINFFLGAINRPPMWRTTLRIFLASRRDFLFCNLLQSGPPSLCCLIQSFLAFRNETCSA